MDEIVAVEWVDTPVPGVRLLDQTLLPGEERHVVATTVDVLVDAIVRLVVRGAPALGAAGALGVAMLVHQARREGWDAATTAGQLARLRDARPTAVNLAGAVDVVAARLGAGPDAVLAAAREVVEHGERADLEVSRRGADWILAQAAARGVDRPLRVLTHCNTGTLATAGRGTALGIVRELHGRGLLAQVRVNETRPLLQGARLTAWELAREGIPHVVQVDGATASSVARGLVDVAVVGADRIAANGDTANKIGTLGVALACRHGGVPFVVAAPWTTVDLATPDGAAIRVEQRPDGEVVAFAGHRTAPDGSPGDNPAFDVTPAGLVDAIVTDRGVVEPSRAPGTAALARLGDHLQGR